MAILARRDEDVVKKYGSIAVVLIVLVGLWIWAPLMHRTGEDSVSIDGSFETSEQSLRSLDSAHNPSGAPGSALTGYKEGMGGSYGSGGAGAAGQQSSLYEAPVTPSAAPGTPLTAEQADAVASAQRSGDSAALAQALKNVADAGKGPAGSDGWGGKAVKTGFSAPRGNFEPKGLATGGASSGAGFTVDKPFGTGGNPGLVEGRGGGLSDVSMGPKGLKGMDAEANRSLSALQSVAKRTNLAGDSELAIRRGQQSFDSAGARGARLAQMAAGGSGAGGAGVDGGEVPMNLKSNDPAINQKEFEPPPVGAAAETKDKNKQYMEQQMMMMLMAVAIGGILGPAFGAIGSSLAAGLGAGAASMQGEGVVNKPG